MILDFNYYENKYYERLKLIAIRYERKKYF